jgi:hypothetical protein
MEILGAGVTLAVTNYQARPDSIVTIAEADAIGRIESGVTGGVAWEKSTMRGPVVKEGQERDNALRDAVFDRLVYWRKTLKSAECLGLEAVDGKQAYKVALTPMIGSAQTVYFDRDSGLLVKAESIYEGAAGKFPVVALMGDYRQVDGIKIAYSSTVTLMDQTRVTTVERVEQNAVMPADRFALPAEIKALVKK